jgi:hypothetical protein
MGRKARGKREVLPVDELLDEIEAVFDGGEYTPPERRAALKRYVTTRLRTLFKIRGNKVAYLEK